MGRSKRSYQWVGAGSNLASVPDASTAVSDVVQLVPAIKRTDPTVGRTDCLIEAIYIHVSTRRDDVGIVDALGLIVWVGNVAEASANPVQSLDALSTDVRAYANKGILILEPIAVPPLLASGDLVSATPSDAVLVSKHTFRASRKLDRGHNVLCAVINCDLSGEVNCFLQARVLLSYGSR